MLRGIRGPNGGSQHRCIALYKLGHVNVVREHTSDADANGNENCTIEPMILQDEGLSILGALVDQCINYDQSEEFSDV